MHRFTFPLEVCEDPSSGIAQLGLVINGTVIFEPSASECGRFLVAPETAYGLSTEDVSQLESLNKLVADATQAALDAGCQAVQKALGVTAGDWAGAHFSEAARTSPVAKAMAEYILAEYQATHP